MFSKVALANEPGKQNSLCLRMNLLRLMLSEHSCFSKLFQSVGNMLCLQCFDAVGWVAGRASGL